MTELVDPQPLPGRTPGVAPAVAPADPLAPVRGRVLVHTDTRYLKRAHAAVDPVHSGLVITGDGAEQKAGELRRAGFTGVLMADPGRYSAFATTDEPFIAHGPRSLLSVGTDGALAVLQEELGSQTGRGATFALSPTGYLAPEDAPSFKAAARAITEFGNPRMIFVVPISAIWLDKNNIGQTIAILRKVPGVKALVLGGQMDPLKGLRARSVANLCALLAEVPDVAVLRTDIAAVGTLAHGAVFTSFGVTSSQRHLVPPKEDPETGRNGGPNSPAVLYPQLMSFYLGATIADRHADGSAPVCWCPHCNGLTLDRFPTRENQAERKAIAHNIAIVTQWSLELGSPEGRSDPRAWWRTRCKDAVDQTTQLNAQLLITTGKSFSPSKQLTQWAEV